ncbi:LrgB family protein [Psychrobium sp. 1_MG-2023]|uniref:LrgB family protein n=1 Tax=Psychrobium sp. 1_MG-2023 TaxID=3062624 RepID=UPI000C3226E8|nr:LrgB family protein [Psychrobium sp. 1_MG-2023]MDP2560063.1 LrgB family protein [Psychrobium sp. 1_MG-2023]PKF56275.1 CidB/LrgB family autolysis modulator [Alteromonadales bacterium alter-6D02]
MIYSYLLATVIVFLGCKWLLASFNHPLANPLLWSIVTFITLFSVTPLDYQDYAQANTLFIALLEPAVVALAIPLFLQLQQIKAQKFAIFLSCSVGVFMALISGTATAWLMTNDLQLLLSLLPKSVTSPIAMAIANQVGGIASLSAAVVIFVGLVGAVFGFQILKLFNITNKQAQGVAMGCSAHAIGTAKAIEAGQTQGAFSSLALVICGVMTAILAPLFAWFIAFL